MDDFLQSSETANAAPGLPHSREAEEAVQAALPRYKLRSRTVSSNGVELMGEVRMNLKEANKVDELLRIKGDKDVSLVSYRSDSTGEKHYRESKNKKRR